MERVYKRRSQLLFNQIKMQRVQCNQCQSWFSRGDNMKRHQRNVHVIQPLPSPCPTQQLQDTSLPKGRLSSRGPTQPLLESQQVEDFVLRHPFTANVSGPTSCGKTYFVKTLLQNCATKISPSPQRIIWLYKRWQPLYDVIKETVFPMVEFIQGIPLDIDQDSFIDPGTRNLVILDDLMTSCSKDPRINELFTEGSHHRNLSVIAINQNLYYNKDPTQRRNCYYLVMFNNPVDKQQVMILARQMYPENPQYLMKHFQAATGKPYGYFLVDLKPFTPEHLRMRSRIFDIIRRRSPEQNETPIDRIKDTMQQQDSIQEPNSLHKMQEQQSMANMPSCDDCGLVFGNVHDLQKHVKTWCPLNRKRKRDGDEEDVIPSKKWIRLDSESDDENSMDDENWIKTKNTEERKVFNVMMDKARAENEGEWEKKYEKYINEGLAEKKANRKADEKMRTDDMKRFNVHYGKFIQRTLQLQDSPIHEKVMDDVGSLIADGYEKEKAIKLALHKRRYLFEAMWDYDKYEDEDEDEDQDVEERTDDENDERTDEENE